MGQLHQKKFEQILNYIISSLVINILSINLTIYNKFYGLNLKIK
jgi:hypothetical protein